jgi:hypothetical protein
VSEASQQRRRVNRTEIGINSGVYEDGEGYVSIQPDGEESHLDPDDAGLAGYDLMIAGIQARTDADWLAVIKGYLGADDGNESAHREIVEIYNKVKRRRGRR